MLDLTKIKFDASPNFSTRGAHKPELIIMHCPVGTLQGTVSTFKNPSSRVSAHYVVDRDGSILQMVKLDQAAWHAMNYPNLIGIGIEHVDRYDYSGRLMGGCMVDPNWFTEAQMQASANLVYALMKQFNIPVEKVMGHNDPWLRQFHNTHQDPGPYWNWYQYRLRLEKCKQADVPEAQQTSNDTAE